MQEDNELLKNHKHFDEEIIYDYQVPFPEGGLAAWSVVAGAVLVSFATLGWVNSFGVFQSYYKQHVLITEVDSNVAWIGSIQYCFVRFPAFFTGWLLDRGHYRGPFAASSLFYVLSLFLVAECHTYWQFVLCQGVATGLFAGMLFGTTPAVVSHWFEKRQSFALGVFAAGSSVGGTVLPILMQQLLDRQDFQSSMRIMACVLSVPIFISNLLLRPRLPPSTAQHSMFDFSVFKNPAFVFCVLAQNVAFLGIVVPLSYLNLSAQVAEGEGSSAFTFYLIPIANCASLLGRVSAGYLADKSGPLNVLIPFTFIAGITCYAWPFATSSVGCAAIISIIYGWAMGAFIALLPSAPIRMGGMEDAGSRVGMATTFISFGGAGSLPLAGLILAKSGGFTDVGVYAGSTIMLGCVFLVIARWFALRKWTGNV